MNGLPAGFDPRVFVGCEVDSVCFYEFSLVIVFRAPISISITSSVVYSLDGPHEQQIPITTPTKLLELPGKTVLSASTGVGTLTLNFENRAALSVFDVPDTEAYVIQLPSRRIVV